MRVNGRENPLTCQMFDSLQQPLFNLSAINRLTLLFPPYLLYAYKLSTSLRVLLQRPVSSFHCKNNKFITGQCHAQIIISKVSVTGWAPFQSAPAGHHTEGQTRASDVQAGAERSEQGAHRSTSRSLNPRVVLSEGGKQRHPTEINTG